MPNPTELTINETVANGSINLPATQAIDTDGIVPVKAKSLTDRLLLEVDNNAAADLDVTIKAGVNPPSHLSQDLVVTVPATSGHKMLGPFESGRFAQADGDIDVEFTAASSTPTAAVRVYRLPKT